MSPYQTFLMETYQRIEGTMLLIALGVIGIFVGIVVYCQWLYRQEDTGSNAREACGVVSLISTILALAVGIFGTCCAYDYVDAPRKAAQSDERANWRPDNFELHHAIDQIYTSEDGLELLNRLAVKVEELTTREDRVRAAREADDEPFIEDEDILPPAAKKPPSEAPAASEAEEGAATGDG